MNTFNISFYAGLLGGLLFAAILFIVKKKRGRLSEFDERQELVRGKAFKCGFWAFIIYLLLYPGISELTGFRWDDDLTSSLMSICVGLGFFIVYSIWHDAYFALRENPRPWAVFISILMICNIFLAVKNLPSSIGCIHLGLSILCFTILITMGFKTIRDKNDQELE